MHISDLKKSRFLTKHDCEPPILRTISSVEWQDLENGGKRTQEMVMFFEEEGKPLILKPTNGEIIAAIVGTGDIGDNGANWAGTKIVLYHDPNVSYAGKILGGIRVRAPKNKAAKPSPAMPPKPPKPEPVYEEPEPESQPVEDIPF